MIEFEGFKPIDGGICAAEGFLAGGIAAEIKKGSTKKDIAIIYSKTPCTAAAIYTTNKVKGAPITVTEKHLQNGIAQAVVVNSGNANTCNANGIEIAEKMCKLTADSLGISASDVIVGSTGVIGQPMSIEPFEKFIPTLTKNISANGSADACAAIMTTDTRKKELAVEFTLGGKTCRLGGISKGSGMINPKMATLLAFVTTDVKISAEMLKKALLKIVKVTYNCVSVDGDTSTNDTLAIMASGTAGNPEITAENADFDTFCGALKAVLTNLARETARDGEGATKLLECIVSNASTEDVALAVGKSVIMSNLLKAAIFAADANWGRILCAIGYADADFDINKISVALSSKAGTVQVFKDGAGVEFSEDFAHNVLLEDEIQVLINMNAGKASASAWGCDLTYNYVKINAEYRS